VPIHQSKDQGEGFQPQAQLPCSMGAGADRCWFRPRPVDAGAGDRRHCPCGRVRRLTTPLEVLPAGSAAIACVPECKAVARPCLAIVLSVLRCAWSLSPEQTSKPPRATGDHGPRATMRQGALGQETPRHRQAQDQRITALLAACPQVFGQAVRSVDDSAPLAPGCGRRTARLQTGERIWRKRDPFKSQTDQHHKKR